MHVVHEQNVWCRHDFALVGDVHAPAFEPEGLAVADENTFQPTRFRFGAVDLFAVFEYGASYADRSKVAQVWLFPISHFVWGGVVRVCAGGQAVAEIVGGDEHFAPECER